MVHHKILCIVTVIVLIGIAIFLGLFYGLPAPASSTTKSVSQFSVAPDSGFAVKKIG